MSAKLHGSGPSLKYVPLRLGDFMQDSNAKDWNKGGPIVQAQKMG